MHGDSLLMLTTKVVSNKKPPLLSDSESGGSTSLYIRINMHLISVSTDSTNYKIYECFIIQKNKKFLHSNISFKYKLDILRRCLNIDLY